MKSEETTSPPLPPRGSPVEGAAAGFVVYLYRSVVAEIHAAAVAPLFVSLNPPGRLLLAAAPLVPLRPARGSLLLLEDGEALLQATELGSEDFGELSIHLE